MQEQLYDCDLPTASELANFVSLCSHGNETKHTVSLTQMKTAGNDIQEVRSHIDYQIIRTGTSSVPVHLSS